MIGIALLLGTLHVPVDLMGAQDPIPSGAAVLSGENDVPSDDTQKREVSVYPHVAAPLQPELPTIFRDIPSISGRYSLGGKAIIPYVGAGFSGGYALEFN